jgi:hypothetical protein
MKLLGTVSPYISSFDFFKQLLQCIFRRYWYFIQEELEKRGIPIYGGEVAVRYASL